MAKEKFTAKQMCEAIRAAKGMVTVAADRLGCDADTVRHYAKRHSSVDSALKSQRSRMGDVAELALYRAIQNGEPWAVALYLRTQCRDRGYVERHEVSGPEGQPIRVDARVVSLDAVLIDPAVRDAAIVLARALEGGAGIGGGETVAGALEAGAAPEPPFVQVNGAAAPPAEAHR